MTENEKNGTAHTVDEAPIDIEAQAKEFRDAIMQVLNTVNHEIVAAGGKPQIDAVTRALTSVLAEFIAMQPDRIARRMQIKEVEVNLPRLIALRTAK